MFVCIHTHTFLKKAALVFPRFHAVSDRSYLKHIIPNSQKYFNRFSLCFINKRIFFKKELYTPLFFCSIRQKKLEKPIVFLNCFSCVQFPLFLCSKYNRFFWTPRKNSQSRRVNLRNVFRFTGRQQIYPSEKEAVHTHRPIPPHIKFRKGENKWKRKKAKKQCPWEKGPSSV